MPVPARAENKDGQHLPSKKIGRIGNTAKEMGGYAMAYTFTSLSNTSTSTGWINLTPHLHAEISREIHVTKSASGVQIAITTPMSTIQPPWDSKQASEVLGSDIMTR
mmetsp:Transcript_116893/g.227313  ORF Transcript_116893/g.227313 Transcript_116893/m.227313 type:complete len:107 (-) Transcript_116893:101-421(-)